MTSVERDAPPSCSFKELVMARVKSDPEFRQALRQEAVQTLTSGDVDTAHAILRDFIHTVPPADEHG